MLFPCRSYAAPAVCIYALPRVIGLDDQPLEGKAPAFAKWVKEKGNTPILSKEFVQDFESQFRGITVNNIDAANKHNVIVASLHLVRASQYGVRKISNIEYCLPLTLSIVFMDPVTTDVIYSFTDTSYAPVTLADSESPENSDGLLREAVGNNYTALVHRLITKARAGYNPAQTDVSVAKIWKGLYILDKGIKFGIAGGDSLADRNGNTIQVMYTTGLRRSRATLDLECNYRTNIFQVRRPKQRENGDKIQGALCSKLETGGSPQYHSPIF